MSIELDAPAIGHNSPPSDADVLRERLEAENADLIARLEVLLQSFKMAPEQIPDDDTAGRARLGRAADDGGQRAAGDGTEAACGHAQGDQPHL